jgi:hypothetical protein
MMNVSGVQQHSTECQTGANSFVEAVISLAGRRAWKGSATDLLIALTRVVPRGVLPETPSGLSGELRLCRVLLEERGVRVAFVRQHRQRMISLVPDPTD